MRKTLSVVSSLLLTAAATQASTAGESTWEYSVQASASVKESPAQIALSWPQDSVVLPTSYTISRKAPADAAWGAGVTLPGTTTNYVDTNVTVGTPYEYQIVKRTSLYTGYGYLYSGIKLHTAENRGKLLLVVDNTYAKDLAPELARLQQDLVGDGWTVTRLDVGRTDSVVSVKNLIKAHYNADPANVKCVFLFGHVPVPYSGDIVPDGHVPVHQGAWPCDGFYGDMDGTWTDETVSDTGASDARNRNVPGDGKYDQSQFPAPLKLMVGRVDLANLPGKHSWNGPATFPSELELLRNYLEKDHNFRTGQFNLPRRGIVGDFFGIRNGEAFAASGWRNFSSFFGASNITTVTNLGEWAPMLSTNSYLWAYGCGAGSYTSIAGLGNTAPYNDLLTTELMAADIKAAFTMLYGSWLGDWDSEDNILRTVLALPTYGLTCAWSGRPHYFFQSMAMGEPIGYGIRLTQNNGANGLYQNEVNSTAGGVQVALMGDPTLRMHVVAPPTGVRESAENGTLALNWTPSKEHVLGYHVYAATNVSGPFTRLTSTPIQGTNYTVASAGAANYMVRAVKRETSGSGTYVNLSEGAFLRAPVTQATAIAGTGAAKGAPNTKAPSPLRSAGALQRSYAAVKTDVPALTPTGTANGQPEVEAGALPDVSRIDYLTPERPQVGDAALHIISPTLLELKLMNTTNSTGVSQWNFVDNSGQFSAPPVSALSVTADGQPIGISAIGFKRRPLVAPYTTYDVRIENSLYLVLSTPVADGQAVQVNNPDGTLWSGSTQFAAKVDPLRYNPAIHVNQEGYQPNYTKKAMIGYYAGNLGELIPPTSGGFQLVDAATGKQVFQGKLTARPDVGYTYTPTPYQQVYEADFTAFKTPGEYRLVVPGMGGSVPFLINDGVMMAYARAYALGMYHQRCGTAMSMPFTRFTHGKCHAAPVVVPTTAAAYPFTWNTISNYSQILNGDNPPQKAPALTGPDAQLFPFVNQGPLDVSGGHHDAGDYSKYTLNSALLVHLLTFTADAMPGVAALDNLGIPESGDGIPDVLQEAKWEADFLAKLQDADGGFYFLVYPRNREYEGDVTPDHGDPQLVYPKTSSATAAAVAALAQCASSPLFKKYYPQAAATYLAKAKLGWTFLLNAINKYGKDGIYQKITHYGDAFTDKDELAWAACEMFLATGNPDYQKLLISWFDPADPGTLHYGWQRMYGSYGNAIRSYAFATRTGRIAANQLDTTFLSKCRAQIAAAADDAVGWSTNCAYGSSLPGETKAVRSSGWYFSGEQAFDITVGYVLNHKQAYLDAILANVNYEGGCNPVNVTFVTGLGWKRQREIVSQWAANDKRAMPPSGIAVGNIQSSFGYQWNYGTLLDGLTFPSDGANDAPYPIYDRWADNWNVSSELVHPQMAKCLANVAFLAAQGNYKNQAWKAPKAQIVASTPAVAVGSPVTVSLRVPGMDLSNARITWEAKDQEPVFGTAYTFVPQTNGVQWVEAEAQWPDGRRAFAQGSVTAQ